MRNPMRMMAAIVTSACVLAFHGGALAQTGTAKTPTQSDFDLCNREAQIGGSTTGGSASPPTPGSATSGTMSTGSSATGSVGAGAATGSTTTGSTLGSGSSTAGSASASGDAQLRGIASADSANPAYQQAYRDCMRTRGF